MNDKRDWIVNFLIICIFGAAATMHFMNKMIDELRQEIAECQEISSESSESS